MKIEPNESLNHPSHASTNVNYESSESLLQNDSPKRISGVFSELSFSFGSQTLAIIYMANTMVIPEMNQVQNEISFASMRLFLITLFQYFSLLICICIPSYLMIKQCEKSNSPFYNQVISEMNPRLGRIFLQCNMAINIIAMFNLVIRLVDFTMNSAPCMYRPVSQIMSSATNSYFFAVWFVYYITYLLIHYGLYRISFFENFNQLQGRLLVTFISKWSLFMLIFILISMKDKCPTGYLPEPESLISSFDFRSMAYYYTNVIYCLSFPFIEIYYIKRETQSHSRSSFTNVKKVYKIQLLLRSSFFFLQICGWGILQQIMGHEALKCSQQTSTQLIMMTLTFLTIITAAPIYANNYALNMQVYRGELMESNASSHKKLVAEAYSLSAFLMTVLFILVIALRLVTGKFWSYREQLVDATQGFQGFCFGVVCIVIPLQVQARKTRSAIGRLTLYILSAVSVGAFTLVALDVGIETYYLYTQ